MASDGFTRVVLVLILGCLVALVVREFTPADPPPSEGRGRYAVNMVRHRGDFVIVRTDTHSGVVTRTMLKAGGAWEIYAQKQDSTTGDFRIRSLYQIYPNFQKV